MKKTISFFILILLWGCATIPVNPSYSFIVPREKSELVWGRAHAYFAKVFNDQGKKFVPRSSEYVVAVDNYAVTREMVDGGVLFRVVVSPVLAERRGNTYYLSGGTDGYQIRGIVADLMDYLQTGKSDLMKDRPVPEDLSDAVPFRPVLKIH